MKSQITRSDDKIILKDGGIERKFALTDSGLVYIESRIIENGTPRSLMVTSLSGAAEIAAVAKWLAAVAERMQAAEGSGRSEG